MKSRASIAIALVPLVLLVALGAWARHRIGVVLTASIPVGFYLRDEVRPEKGEIGVFRMWPTLAHLAHARGYAPPSVDLLAKYVRAVGGDHVCARDGKLLINGELAGEVRTVDSWGRQLPHTEICEVLGESEVFLLGSHRLSFDSRAFGPIPRELVNVRYRPLLTWNE